MRNISESMRHLPGSAKTQSKSRVISHPGVRCTAFAGISPEHPTVGTLKQIQKTNLVITVPPGGYEQNVLYSLKVATHVACHSQRGGPG